MDEIDEARFEQIVRKIHPQGRLLRVWPLQGGVSAQVTALEIARSSGQTEKRVVRRYGAGDLRRNPAVADDEFKLLKCLKAQGLAVPASYLVDTSGEIFPTPYVVIEFVEGKIESHPANLHDFVFQLALHLSQIHGVAYEALDLTFLPEKAREFERKLHHRPETLDASLDEGRIRAALDLVWPIAQQNPSVLLHGDFWSGNTLWAEGYLTAVIDWETAGWGDPLVDVGNARLELLWAFGLEAMKDFTALYHSMRAIDLTELPSWDLVAALRPAHNLSTWGLDAATEQKMIEAHRWFVNQALDALAR